MTSKVLSKVFVNRRYLFGAGAVAFIVVSAALLLPNINALKQVFSSDAIGVLDKISFLISLYGSIVTNFTIVSGAYLLLVAMLFGINVALLVFYIRRRQEVSSSKRIHLAGLGGMMSAVLGIGCAACGSVVLTAVFGLLGASSIIAFLPLHGYEFGIIGVVLLVFSIRYLIKKINDPLICPID